MRHFRIDYSDGRRSLWEITEKELARDFEPTISLTDEEFAKLDAFLAQDAIYQKLWRDAENEWYSKR